MSNFDCDAFCERAIELFGDAGQIELSKKIGLAQGVISSIKNKKVKTPAADTVAKIAAYFNVSADYLLGLSQNPTIRKATSIYTLEFTFIGAAASENHAEDAKRFAEYLREHTIADDVQVLSSKIFLHDTSER